MATSVGNWFAVYNNAWNLAANVTAPILHGGELTAAKKAAIEASKATRAGYEADGAGGLRPGRDRARRACSMTASWSTPSIARSTPRERSLKLTRDSYQGGNVGILLVLDAQRRYQQARLGYVRAVQQRYLDTVQLFAAMGGGWRDWEKTQEPPKPSPSDPAQIFNTLFSQ